MCYFQFGFMQQAGISVHSERWQAVGMCGSASLDVMFDDAKGQLVGRVGDYLSRPGFWQGGAGIAACWHGGAVFLASALHQAVAKAANAPYATRVAAAKALRRLKAPALTGTDNELVLLAAPVVAVPPALNVYAADIRFDSVATGTPAQQLDKAAAILAIRPEDTALRLTLLRAAIAARRDGLTLTLAPQMLSNNRGEPDESLLPGLAPADRLAIIRGVAEAHERALEWGSALRLYRAAGLTQAATTAEAAFERQLENDKRRPVFAKELEQDRLVRPMIAGVAR